LTKGLHMDAIFQDVRFGFRMLVKAPSFTATVVLTLALGIGCAMAMFSLVEGAILIRPPVQELDRIANVWVVNKQTGTDRGLLSVPTFLDLRDHAAAFEELAAFVEAEKVLTNAGEPRRVGVLMVSSNFFHMLGVNPKIGRVFAQGEDQPGSPHIAVISEGMWSADFGGKPDMLGQSIQLDRTPYTIVGVMPGSFWYPGRGTELWTPLALDPSADRAAGAVAVAGRLRKRVTAEQASAEASALSGALEPRSAGSSGGMGMRVVGYKGEQDKRSGLGIAFMLGPSLMVLLIACANITNLLLARGFGRQLEFASRAALGAGRRRIVQQLLTEYLMLTIAGGAVGVLAAYAGVAALRRAFEFVQPFVAASIRLNWHALAFGTTAVLLIPLLFGLTPALRASKANLNDALRQKGTAAGARITLKRLPLVVFEIAMAMLLLVICGLFIRTLIDIERVSLPKIEVSKVVTFTISSDPNGHDWNRLLTDLAAVHGISAVGATADLPLMAARKDERPLEVEYDATHKQALAIQMDVNAGFFDALQLHAVQGRLPFNGEAATAIVSDAFARQNGGSVIGLKIHHGDSAWVVVVGVVRDWLTDVRSGQPLPTVYFPISKTSTTLQILVRADGGALVVPSLKRAVHTWNPDEPVDNCQTVAQSVNDQLAGSNLVVRLFAVFALLALVLALIGVYGVMNYSTVRRTHEMGIRIALGATRWGVFALVLSEASLLLAVGIGIGWLMGVAGGRVIGHELLVTPADPVTAVACSSVILLAGLVASYVPARRAARVDPMTALRSE